MDECSALALGEERVRNAELAKDSKVGGLLKTSIEPKLNRV